MPKNFCIMQIWAEPEKAALPICNYSQILYRFLLFTQKLQRIVFSTIPTYISKLYSTLVFYICLLIYYIYVYANQMLVLRLRGYHIYAAEFLFHLKCLFVLSHRLHKQHLHFLLNQTYIQIGT